MHGIVPRDYTAQLHEYLSYFPCFGLIGPRQCGKTTLLGEPGANWTRFDLEKQFGFEAISRNPDLFFRLHPDSAAVKHCQSCLVRTSFNSEGRPVYGAREDIARPGVRMAGGRDL